MQAKGLTNCYREQHSVSVTRGAPVGLKLNSPYTAGKSCSARDLNQLSVCLLVVCLVTTTVGEAYLVRTIGRRSESQFTRPKSVLSGSPRARQCRTACRPSWRWHSRVENKHRTRNSVPAFTARDALHHQVLICLRILIGRSVACPSVSSAATELGSKMVARCSVFVRQDGSA